MQSTRAIRLGLLAFSGDTSDDPPNSEFHVAGETDRRVARVLCVKLEGTTDAVEPFYGQLVIDDRNDDGSIGGLERFIDDEDIAGKDARAFHAQPDDADKKRRRRVGDEMLVQVEHAFDVVVGRGGEPRVNRVREERALESGCMAKRTFDRFHLEVFTPKAFNIVVGQPSCLWNIRVALIHAQRHQLMVEGVAGGTSVEKCCSHELLLRSENGWINPVSQIFVLRLTVRRLRRWAQAAEVVIASVGASIRKNQVARPRLFPYLSRSHPRRIMTHEEIDLSTPLAHVNSLSGWQTLLERIVHRMDCVTGTLHRIDPEGEVLVLVVQVGVPDVVLPKIEMIPLGKGIAGAAAENREAVQMCNLQTDTSGVACEDAKKTAVAGSLAVPVLHGETLVGTLGVGMASPHEFTDSETETLWEIARWLAPALGRPNTMGGASARGLKKGAAWMRIFLGFRNSDPFLQRFDGIYQ